MTASSSSRRRFLRRLAGGAAGAAIAPAFAPDLLSAAASADRPGRVPRRPAAANEEYWKQIKAQFPLRDGITPMNAANLCPAPFPVIDAWLDALRDLDADVSFQNRAKFSGILEDAREKLARYFGVLPDELAIVRNTTEANNIIVGGLELGAGDEVLLFDENHPTNNVAWDVRAARYGFEVRRVSVDSPTSPEAVLDTFRRALSPRTSVLAFSDVSNTTGLRLPTAELCAMARERGIYTHVDGAQTFGALRRDLHALGCDSYAASAHKWFMGPKEAGVLFVREARVSEIWPGIVGVGWGGGVEPSADGARKFETLGQRNDATFAAMAAAVDFHERIGVDRVEQRVLELASALRDGLGELPGAEFVTPAGESLSAGVVIVRFAGEDNRGIYSRLYDEHGFGAAPTGGLRFSTHVYNTMEDIERAVAATAEIAGSPV